MASLTISRTGLPQSAASIIAEFLGMRAQDVRDAAEHPGALERRDVAPLLERGLCGGDRRIDVGCAGIRDLAKGFAGARIDRIRLASRNRLMPCAGP
jgi:hypothetical protein